MSPEAVIDRYLAIATREPFDAEGFLALLGTDADLLGRWLTVLDCPADPQRFSRALAELAPQRFRDLAIAQALAVLGVSGIVRFSFEQWYTVLEAGQAGALLAAEIGVEDADAAGWRLLLAASGVNVPGDPVLEEMLAFRGTDPALLEGASAAHRLLAVVDALTAGDAVQARDTAQQLLGLESERLERVLENARQRCRAQLDTLNLAGAAGGDPAETLWLRLQLGVLGHLFEGTEAAVWENHALVTRRLFGAVPGLMLARDGHARLAGVDDGPEISLDGRASAIARCARAGERVELADAPDQAVADRQVLRRLGYEAAVCLPLVCDDRVPGMVIFADDDESGREPAMQVYADELARHLAAPPAAPATTGDALAGYRQREEKRLRELVHEANNPLSIVNNYLHILQLKLTHEPEAVEQLKLIGSELRRAGDIIGRMRDLPEVEGPNGSSEDTALQAAELDLNALAHRLVELHLGYARDHHVSLHEALSSEPLTVVSDEDRLAQVLNNLVRNAIEASREATVTVSTAGGVFREGREGVLLEVSDTGPGLPRSVLERLAQPKRSSKGGDHSGLGLHIVHRLVTELGGSLDVRTAPEQGSTFSIFLPVHAARAPGASGR
ncbi:MAG: sensor histidine kinase [Pseudomonadota bacterium]